MSNRNIYLAAFYSMRPRDHVRTNRAGWQADASNIQYDERVEITRGTKKNSTDAKILLNLSTKTVERNSWGDNRSFNDLFKYFFGGYHQYMTQVMTKLDPEYFVEMLEEMKAELKEEMAASDEAVQTQ